MLKGKKATHAKLNADLAYIKQYSAREAVRLAKLWDAVDVLMEFLRRSLQNEPMQFPRGWQVCFSRRDPKTWNWHLENNALRQPHPYLYGPSDCEADKPHELLMRFSRDLETGWLDEVGELLAKHRRAKIAAVKEIESFIA
jgi:hypothetical protein